MKTPNEIKKGLQYCFMEEHSDCSGCPYYDSEEHELKCLDEIQKDAFAYIQQLESRLAQVERELKFKEKCLEWRYRDIARGEDLLDEYAAKLAQVERERDALIKHAQGKCHACKHADGFPNEGLCDSCKHTFHAKRESAENWQWRGVCDENTKEDADENTEKV